MDDGLVVFRVHHERFLQLELVFEQFQKAILVSVRLQHMMIAGAGELAFVASVDARSHLIPNLALGTGGEALLVEQDASVHPKAARGDDRGGGARVPADVAIRGTIASQRGLVAFEFGLHREGDEDVERPVLGRVGEVVASVRGDAGFCACEALLRFCAAGLLSLLGEYEPSDYPTVIKAALNDPLADAVLARLSA